MNKRNTMILITMTAVFGIGCAQSNDKIGGSQKIVVGEDYGVVSSGSFGGDTSACKYRRAEMLAADSIDATGMAVVGGVNYPMPEHKADDNPTFYEFINESYLDCLFQVPCYGQGSFMNEANVCYAQFVNVSWGAGHAEVCKSLGEYKICKISSPLEVAQENYMNCISDAEAKFCNY